MKKLILTAIVTMAVSVTAHAGPMYNNPSGTTEQPISVFYGGVNYATSVFSAELSTVTFSSQTVIGPTVVYGVDFSSGNCGNGSSVEVFDSTSALNALNGDAPSLRWYNVNGSTGTTDAVNDATCSGFSGPPYPVRFNRGVFFRPSVATYNNIMLYYWKDGN